MPLGRRAVDADLQCQTLARQSAQAFEAAPRQQHSVGEHGRGCRSRAGLQDLADVCEQEGLAAGHEDLPDAEPCCLDRDLADAVQAERAAGCLGRGADAAIVAAQVAVEIRVEPKPRPDGTVRVRRLGSLPVPKDPATAACLDARIHQAVVREAAPSLEIDADTCLAAEDGDEIAGSGATQRRDQLRQQAGGKRLCAGIDLEVHLHRHTSHYNAILRH